MIETVGIPFAVRRPVIEVVLQVAAFGAAYRAVRAWVEISGSDSDQRRQP